MFKFDLPKYEVRGSGLVWHNASLISPLDIRIGTGKGGEAVYQELGDWLNKHAARLLSLPKARQQELVQELGSTAEQMLDIAPKITGAGGVYVPMSSALRKSMAIDLPAYKGYKSLEGQRGTTSVAKMGYYRNWGRRVEAAGGAFGGLSDDNIGNFIYAREDIGRYMAGQGSYLSSRKPTTLENYLGLSGSTPGARLTADALYTAERVLHLQDQQKLFTHGSASSAMHDRVAAHLYNTGKIVQATIPNAQALRSSSVAGLLLGGPAIGRKGIFGDIKAQRASVEAFSLTALGRWYDPAGLNELMQKVHTPGAVLSSEEYVRLKASTPGRAEDLISVLDKFRLEPNAGGVSPEVRAYESLGKRVPLEVSVAAAAHEGDALNLTMQVSHGLVEGNKVSFLDRKARLGTLEDAGFDAALGDIVSAGGLSGREAAAVRGADVILPPISAKGGDVQRIMRQWWEPYLNALTIPEAGVFTEEQTVANLDTIAAGFEKTLGTKAKVIRLANGQRRLEVPGVTAFNMKATRYLHDLLVQSGQGAVAEDIASLRRLPVNMHALPQELFSKIGPEVGGVSALEALGFQIEGYGGLAQQVMNATAPRGGKRKAMMNEMHYISASYSGIPGYTTPTNKISYKDLDYRMIQTFAPGRGGIVPQPPIGEGNPLSILYHEKMAKATKPTGSEFSAYYMPTEVELPVDVVTKSGKTTNKILFTSANLKNIRGGAAGTVRSSEQLRIEQAILANIAGTGGNLSQPELQRLVTRYESELETVITGKEGLYNKAILKGRSYGAQGSLGFLSDEAERGLLGQFEEGADALGGMVGVTEEQFIKLRGLNALRKLPAEQRRSAIESMVRQGEYMISNRNPSPAGMAVARVGIIDYLSDRTKAGMITYNDQILESAGMGLFKRADIDGDMVRIISGFSRTRSARTSTYDKLAKDAFVSMLPQYRAARTEAESKMVSAAEKIGSLSSFEEFMGSEEVASAAGRTQLDLLDDMLQKKFTTGPAHSLMIGVAEGARYNKLGDEEANRLTKVARYIYQEGGLDIKQQNVVGGAVSNLQAAMWDRDLTMGERVNLTRPLLEGINKKHPELGGVDDTTITNMFKSYDAGNAQGMIAKSYSKLVGRSKSSLAQPMAFRRAPDYAMGPAEVVDSTLMGMMRNAGSIQSVGQNIGEKNAAVAAAVEQPRTWEGKASEAIDWIGKRVSDYGEGLKAGKGWGKLAIGAGVLAGIGLSLRRPPRMDTMEATQESDQPVVIPRRQRNLSVMTKSQYDVRIKLRDAQRQDNRAFINLSEAIAGKFSQPSNVRMHIRDDSNDVNYDKVFRDAYNQEMRAG
jgi:hypothetical protein